MKKLLLIISVFLLGFSLQAQDEAIYSHHTINPILVNPAAAGFQEHLQLHLNARAQWTGFPGAPTTYGAMLNTPLGTSFGIGLGISSESAAQLNRFKLQLNNAFRFKVKEHLKMAAGFAMEFQQMSLDNNATASDLYDGGDKLLQDIVNGKAIFDASLGLYGSYMGKTHFGLSFTNLVRSRLNEISGGSNSENSFFKYYTFVVGHEFDIPDLNFALQPSLAIRQVIDAPFFMDFNLNAKFLDDQLIAGVSYKTLGLTGIMLGTKFSNLQLYYSYDVSFQRFQKFNAGSHEFTLLFAVKKKEKEIKGI